MKKAKWILLVVMVAGAFFSASANSGDGDDDKKRKIVIVKEIHPDSTSDDDIQVTVDDTLVYEDFDTPKDVPTGGGSTIHLTPKGIDNDGVGVKAITCGMKVRVVKDDPETSNANAGSGNITTTKDVTVYPNPASQDQTIRLKLQGWDDAAVLSVISIAGKEVHRSLINSENTTLPELASGTYIIMITSSSASQSKRLIVR